MPARRPADGAHMPRVDAVFIGVGAEEAHRRLTVDELVGEMALGAAAVVDAGHGVARLGQKLHLRRHQVLVAPPPARAVDPHDQRLTSGAHLVVRAAGQAHLAVAVLSHEGQVQVQGPALQVLHLGVADVVDEIDAAALLARVDDVAHVLIPTFVFRF